MPLAITRAGIADLDRAVPLFDAYRRFYGQPSDPARARAFLLERLQREQSIVLLADLDHRAVGFTQLYPMFSSVRTARTCILNDLYVEQTARRQGVGRALLAAAAQAARLTGACRLSLETALDNADARALYRAAGWQADDTQWYSLGLT